MGAPWKVPGPGAVQHCTLCSSCSALPRRPVRTPLFRMSPGFGHPWLHAPGRKADLLAYFFLLSPLPSLLSHQPLPLPGCISHSHPKKRQCLGSVIPHIREEHHHQAGDSSGHQSPVSHGTHWIFFLYRDLWLRQVLVDPTPPPTHCLMGSGAQGSTAAGSPYPKNTRAVPVPQSLETVCSRGTFLAIWLLESQAPAWATGTVSPGHSGQSGFCGRTEEGSQERAVGPIKEDLVVP